MDWNAWSNSAAIAILEADRLHELLGELGCRLYGKAGGSVFRGRCPVHGGNSNSFLLDLTADHLPIRWRCHTRHCHQTFKPSLLGLVRGILSFGKDKPATIKEAMTFIERFLGGRPSPKSAWQPKEKPKPILLSLTRGQVRGRLEIPSPYFVSRGFSPAILDCFDVGHSPMLDLSVVPLYDDRDEVCLGVISRQELPACDRCGTCHHEFEPCEVGKEKWRFPTGFPKGSYLYGLAGAERSSSPSVLLVEGPGDVWRALEAGVTAVASLGADLTAEQASRLTALGKEVVIAYDNDEVGRKGTDNALKRLAGDGLIARKLTLPAMYKDVGEIPVDVLRDLVRELMPIMSEHDSNCIDLREVEGRM